MMFVDYDFLQREARTRIAEFLAIQEKDRMAAVAEQAQRQQRPRRAPSWPGALLRLAVSEHGSAPRSASAFAGVQRDR